MRFQLFENHVKGSRILADHQPSLSASSSSSSTKIRLLNAYLARLQAAAVADPSLAEAFIRVVGMVDRPEGLLRPDRVVRVLLANLRTPHAATPTPVPSTTAA